MYWEIFEKDPNASQNILGNKRAGFVSGPFAVGAGGEYLLWESIPRKYGMKPPGFPCAGLRRTVI